MQETRQGGSRGLSSGQWTQMAGFWAQVGPPLRPSREDINLYQEVIQAWSVSNGAPRVLLLGVTPEIYGLAWSQATDFLAVDRSQAMIDGVWPGPRGSAKCGDWLEMDLAEASRDMVFCDGGLNLLAYPSDHRRLVDVLGRILPPGGLCILRLFAPPSRHEAPEIVMEDLVAGKISNLSVLKLRLWAALQHDASEGVELSAVWRVVKESVGDLEEFAGKIGWPVAQMLAINAYRDAPTHYHLLTVNEVISLFCDRGAFRVGEVRIPAYEYGDRCPIVVLERT